MAYESVKPLYYRYIIMLFDERRSDTQVYKQEVRLHLVQSWRQDERAERCPAVRSPAAVGGGPAPAAALAPT